MKMACREQGYDDKRFVGEINDNLRCATCLGVVKHPVMCQHNEHLFCRCYIEQHLKTLNVETLKPVNRMGRQMIDNRCRFQPGHSRDLRLQNENLAEIHLHDSATNNEIGALKHEVAEMKHEIAETKRSLDEVFKASQGETTNAVRNIQRDQEEIRARQDEKIRELRNMQEEIRARQDKTINAVRKMESNQEKIRDEIMNAVRNMQKDQEEIRAETMNAVRNMQTGNQDTIVEEMRKYFFTNYTEQAGKLIAKNVKHTDEFTLVTAGGFRKGKVSLPLDTSKTYPTCDSCGMNVFQLTTSCDHTGHDQDHKPCTEDVQRRDANRNHEELVNLPVCDRFTTRKQPEENTDDSYKIHVQEQGLDQNDKPTSTTIKDELKQLL